ncbi:MAG TPA: glycosyltransferase 87 family protein, partial [Oligoflexia bacterium]|nr:glycosyltransferase 87 family protein [Oligoflexia bacterium]
MRVRNVILITAAALCCVSLGWSILSVSAQMQLRCGPAGRYDLLDLLINWACVQNFLLGADPYSINDLHHRLALAGCDYRYSPGVFLVPWSLPVLSLVYQFSFPYAATLWLLLMIACAVASAALTWRIFSKQPVRLPLLALVLCSFFPLWSVLRWGHVGPLLALGTIAAVHFARKKQYFLAGFAAVLLTFKAHVVYLVLAAFALHTLFSRNWRSAAAFAGALCALVLTAHYVSPL